MGMPYGSIARKTVPREEQDSAMDFSVLFEFGVRFFFYYGFFVKEVVRLLLSYLDYTFWFFTGLLQVLHYVLWLLQLSAKYWIAAVPVTPVISFSWSWDIWLQSNGGYQNVGLMTTFTVL